MGPPSRAPPRALSLRAGAALRLILRRRGRPGAARGVAREADGVWLLQHGGLAALGSLPVLTKEANESLGTSNHF